jgi:hypothetical protein
MPSGIPRPATAAELAKWGHISTLLRAWAKANDSGALDVASQLGIKNNGQVYKWFSAKAGPGPKFRNKLAKLIGCTPDDLGARRAGQKMPVLTAAPETMALLQRKSKSDVLQFNVDNEGVGHIKLDVKLPVTHAVRFLRIIIDGGVLAGRVDLEQVEDQ